MAKEKKKGRGRRVFGYVLAGLGILSIVDFFSPIPIPTTGVTAIISGALLIGAGLYVIYLRDVDWQGLLKRAISRKAQEQVANRPPLDPLVPVAILKLAREKGGLLTVSTISMALDLPLDTAEAGIEECIRRGVATAEYDEARSTVMYRFPEFLP
jgi:hypothetical protein